MVESEERVFYERKWGFFVFFFQYFITHLQNWLSISQ